MWGCLGGVGVGGCGMVKHWELLTPLPAPARGLVHLNSGKIGLPSRSPFHAPPGAGGGQARSPRVGSQREVSRGEVLFSLPEDRLILTYT